MSLLVIATILFAALSIYMFLVNMQLGRESRKDMLTIRHYHNLELERLGSPLSQSADESEEVIKDE